LFGIFASTVAERRNYTLIWSNGYIEPDCVNLVGKINHSSSVLINGQFPGPDIRASEGDLLIVNIYNRMDYEPMTVHFHGLFQAGTPQMDGVPAVTQLAIKPGENFTHVFHVKQHGTYFYHSHFNLQAITGFGLIIIDSTVKPPVQYDEELSLVISEYWHEDRYGLEAGVIGAPFVWVNEPQSILFNGKTMYNASCPSGYAVLNVTQGKKYRLRVVGGMALNTMMFAISGHNLTLFEIDGEYVRPLKISGLEVASGQRYSVLLDTTGKTPGDYYMSADIRWLEHQVDRNGIGILHYQRVGSDPSIFTKLVTDYSVLPFLINETMGELEYLTAEVNLADSSNKMPPGNADKTIVLTAGTLLLPGGAVRWAINNRTVMLEDLHVDQSFLNLVYNGDTLPIYTYEYYKDQVIDIVFQLTAAFDGTCHPHPFHLHGHNFWEYAHGPGSYDHGANPNRTKLTNNIKRDTTMVYPTQWAYFDTPLDPAHFTLGCGWKKIRYVADNPGIWLIHCHILPHMSMGMVVVLEEDVKHLAMQYLPRSK